MGVVERISKDSILVYHSIADDYTGIGGITVSMIFDFMPLGDFDVAVYRMDISQSKKMEIIDEIRNLKRKKVPFDPLFNIQDTTKLYCAEMVAFAVNKVLGEKIISPSGRFLGKNIYTIEDCYNFPLSKRVYQREGTIIVK